MSFSVWAPNAQHSVELLIEGELLPMSQTTRGYWEL